MGKREPVALLSLFSWCHVIVVWLFLAVPWVCLQFVIVVFPDHTHLLFLHATKLIISFEAFNTIFGRFYLPLSFLPLILFYWGRLKKGSPLTKC